MPFLGSFLLGICLSNPYAGLAQTNSLNISPDTLEVNGTVLHYITVGAGTPVVFVHGSFGDYRTWHYQMEPFARHYKTIAYSRRYYYPNEPATASSKHSDALAGTAGSVFYRTGEKVKGLGRYISVIGK